MKKFPMYENRKNNEDIQKEFNNEGKLTEIIKGTQPQPPKQTEATKKNKIFEG